MVYQFRTWQEFLTFAECNPRKPVRLVFRSNDGTKTGAAEYPAEEAANPNQSGRYFPPTGETASSLGWGMPYWYGSEVRQVVLP